MKNFNNWTNGRQTAVTPKKATGRIRLNEEDIEGENEFISNEEGL